MLRSFGRQIDWLLIGAASLLVLGGVLTMSSFTSQNYFADRQIAWFFIALAVCIGASMVDWRFLRRSNAVTTIFLGLILILGFLLIFGEISRGVKSWFSWGGLLFSTGRLYEVGASADIGQIFFSPACRDCSYPPYCYLWLICLVAVYSHSFSAGLWLGGYYFYHLVGIGDDRWRI